MSTNIKPNVRPGVSLAPGVVLTPRQARDLAAALIAGAMQADAARMAHKPAQTRVIRGKGVQA